MPIQSCGSPHRDPVELVVHAVAAGQHRPHLLELALHLQGVRGEQLPTGMGDEQLAVELHRRDRRPDAVGVDVDGARAVGDRGDELDADPDATRPGQGDRVAAEVQGFLDVAREQDRHVEVDERGVAGAGQGRGLGGRIVADDGHHPAVTRRPGEHAVADRVPRPVEPGRLAVPDPDHAVVALVVEGIDELAPHHRRRGELLVDARSDDDREVGHGGRRRRHLLLERPDR